MGPRGSALALFVVLVLVGVAACSDGGDDTAEATTTTAADDVTTTTAEASTTTTDGGAPAPDALPLLEALAADELEGRDNGTPGSAAARDVLLDEVTQFAEPAYPDRAGPDGYLQPFTTEGNDGTNVLAVIPGGDLADQVVVIGAHYDHLGHDCRGVTDDTICNGATDNAAGVAVAVAAARAVAAEGTPRRTVVLALWDAEEDGLVGSAHYLGDPVIPLDQHVVYINMDSQASNLLPSLKNFTLAVGAETGGDQLIAATEQAAEASTLDTGQLSVLFGQGRSDHAAFVNSGVPAVFFTDATNACYHTVEDDMDVVDTGKLAQQVATTTALLRDLVATDDPPVLVTDAPIATYEDALTMQALVTAGEPDFDMLPTDAQEPSRQFMTDLDAIVAAGADAFDDDDVATLLAGASTLVDALDSGDCSAVVAD